MNLEQLIADREHWIRHRNWLMREAVKQMSYAFPRIIITKDGKFVRNEQPELPQELSDALDETGKKIEAINAEIRKGSEPETAFQILAREMMELAKRNA